MEPSIPFHTLVGFVDAGDITNEKFRTVDLTLESYVFPIEITRFGQLSHTVTLTKTISTVYKDYHIQ